MTSARINRASIGFRFDRMLAWKGDLKKRRFRAWFSQKLTALDPLSCPCVLGALIDGREETVFVPPVAEVLVIEEDIGE